jgi:tRNA A-37 threonylcarbamoyl transferase component Bud32
MKGLQALNSKNILAPEMLYTGNVQGSESYVVIYKRIEPATLFSDVWENADEENRARLFNMIVDTLAHMHKSGLVQKDLHLNNFITHDKDLYTLDASDVEYVGTGAQQAYMDNLVLLLTHFKLFSRNTMEQGLKRYAQSTGVSFTQGDISSIFRMVNDKRRQQTRKYLEKVYRECSALVSSSTFRHVIMLDRQFDTDAMRTVLRNPDRAMDLPDSQMIKNGRTCTVVRIEVNGQPYIIKRYNIKSGLHFVSRAFRDTRASASWRNSHLLRSCGIQSAYPVAFKEDRLGLIRRTAYFLMKYVDGDNCLAYFRSSSIGEEQKAAMAARITEIFRVFEISQVSHGDMKATNILISGDRPVLIDLDAMQQHTQENSFRRAFNKDMCRFFDNWVSLPAIHDLFMQKCLEADVTLPSSINRESSS